MTRVYVGTCSWSDHKGFYPQGLPSNQQISYYARHFPIVEINSTYYHMMPKRNFSLWAERTPDGFVFDVKPYRQLTWHDRRNPPDDEVTSVFRESLQPLRDAGKLGAVHFQFPPWFRYAKRTSTISDVCGGLLQTTGWGWSFGTGAGWKPIMCPSCSTR